MASATSSIVLVDFRDTLYALGEVGEQASQGKKANQFFHHVRVPRNISVFH
jgi:hypothetical protein